MITDNTYETGKRVFHARRAYRVVDDFEAELCDYTGAPFAVAVNSCTNALFLSLEWANTWSAVMRVSLPRRTYVGVLQAALNAGYEVAWRDEPDDWQSRGYYQLWPTEIWDCARSIPYRQFGDFKIEGPTLVCLSLHSAKQLPLGRGGAILTDDADAAEWLRAARMDGRPPGIAAIQFPGWHMPMPPDVAARGLDILSRWNDRGYSPPALPHEDYPDLSLWYP